jgi:NAD(P)-dependent dehydrogenase (short-subunit alcohol dehydrogenase family)
MTTDRRFEGSVAIVTGAGSGLGRATALLLGSDGAKVACLDIRREAGESTASELQRSGGTGAAFLCDIGDPEAVRAAVARAAADLGRPTILCNIAAVQQWAHTLDLSYEDWNRIIAVNLTGTFLMCQAVLPHLIRGGGSIVNVASTAALAGIPYDAAYCASKAAVLMLTRSLAIEFADRGIRVNAIAPGGMDTPMMHLSPPAGSSPRLMARVRGSLLGVAEPEQVARVIAFVASSEADHMSGAVIPVDGAALA